MKTRPDTNNWNPFSVKPGLDFAAFVTTLVAVAVAELAVRFFVQLPLHAARLSLDFKQLGVLYAVWTIASVLGFFFVANSFIKRWMTIYGLSTAPRWMKLGARLFMISPLLSLWATLYTLLFAKDGPIFEDGEKPTLIVGTGALTLVVFHVGFLAWSLTQKNIHFAHSDFHLVNEVSMKDSLRQTLPGAAEDMWLPGERFHVHVYPYLSPLMKLSLSVYGDFARVKTLADEVKKDPDSFCQDVSKYLDESVANCFLTRYRELGKRRAFVTPAFGFLYESMYRQEVSNVKPETAMQSVAMNTLSVENIVSLLEPGELSYNREQFTRPIGMLALFGSPELPAISIGQDLQHEVLTSKFLPLIAPQLGKLSQSIDRMQRGLTPLQEEAAREKLASIGRRLKVLELDPLGLQPASP